MPDRETYRDQGGAKASVARAEHGVGMGGQASMWVKGGAGPRFEEGEAFKQRNASHQDPFAICPSLGH